MFVRIFCGFIVLLLSACMGLGAIIKGSGKITKENRTVLPFSQIALTGTGTLLLVPSEEHRLFVEVDDNLQQYIQTEVKNDTLYIEISKNAALSPSKEITYFVSLPQLAKIDLSGAVTAKSVQALTTKHLDANLSGAGTLDLDVLTDSLRVSLSGSGDVLLKGRTEKQEVDVSGAGSYQGFGLASNTAHIVVSGVGNAEVYVNEKLDIEISGVGSVIYRGKPVLRQKISGVGTIRQEEELKEAS